MVDESVPDDWYSYNVLDVAQALHMGYTGAGDSMPPAMRNRARAWLQRRVDGWRPSVNDNCRRFDDAVLQVCRAALEEVKDG